MGKKTMKRLAVLGVAACSLLAVGVPSASANHVDVSHAQEIFDVDIGTGGDPVKVPVTIKIGGQKILGPPEEDYLLDNVIQVPPTAAGASLVGTIEGHSNGSPVVGPAAPVSCGGKPGQRFEVATFGGSLKIKLELVGRGILTPASEVIETPDELQSDGAGASVEVCGGPN